MSGTGLELARRHLPDMPDYPGEIPPWSVLVELAGAASANVDSALERLLETLFDAGTVVDGALATSIAQADSFWALREATVEAQAKYGAQLKHDIAVPVGSLPEFIEAAEGALRSEHDDLLINAFGHAGDGNVHFNVSPGDDIDAVRDERISSAVYRIALEYGGTIAAEHGVGRLKRERYLASLDPARRTLLTTLRAGLDPEGLFNPHILPLACLS